MNGFYINCDNDEAYTFFKRMFGASSFRFTNLNSWLESKVEPLPGT